MTSDAAPSTQPPFERALRFGRFSLDPARKLLLADDRAVRLGGRALDLLVALVERAGEVVSHDELFARVWPHTVVEESSLRVHMSALRKALGDSGDTRYIASVPGRGYSFVMDVAESWRAASTAQADAPPAAPSAAPSGAPPSLPAVGPDSTAASPLPRPLPPRLTELIGREAVLGALAAKLQRCRLVTIVGAGGIGKTTVALALADALAGQHAHGALFVDLAPLDDPSLVPAALAAAMGIAVPAQSPWPGLEAALASHDLLVVLDNCEHVIGAAAALAEHVLRAAARVRILATSREPLAAESEALYRLEALQLPPQGRDPAIADALAFPALRLFVERATASADGFALSQANLPAIVRLCRHLDGLPLAIELAAARVDSLGIHALAERLDDVFRLLRRGRRTVLPRHQTLQALLDWSHGLLDEDERVVLHRLSAFRSSFTLDAAIQLASCERIRPERVVTCVLDLVSRSLVELEGGDVQRYRLLFVTRLYAGQKLSAGGDDHAIGRRHAACFRDLLARASAELNGGRVTLAAWLKTHAPIVPDIRAAHEWTESPDGDRLLGAELVVESGRLLLELGLNDDILPRALDALAVVRAAALASAQLELRLLVLLCAVSGQSLSAREIPAGIPAQLDALAQRIGSPQQRRSALQALCVNAFGHGDYPRVVDCAARLDALDPDPADPANAGARLVGRRFDALGRHYLGDHRAAWASCAYVIERAAAGPPGHPYTQMPAQVSMGILQARILWLQGRADRALARAFETVEASKGSHLLALSQALSLAVIPILLWQGDDDGATSCLERLVDHDLAHCQSFWLAWCDGYCRVLARRGRLVENIRQRLGPARNRLNEMQGDMLATLAPELAGPEQLARVEAGIVGWCAPEILRVHGERLWANPAQRAHAEPVLLRALALARRQGARAWELRAATSIATLWHSTGRRQAASETLVEVVAGFSEGLGGIDMRRARALLDGWRAPVLS